MVFLLSAARISFILLLSRDLLPGLRPRIKIIFGLSFALDAAEIWSFPISDCPGLYGGVYAASEA